ncbi:MAG: hypothetical protein ACPG31_10080 [Planctomycetota bacterium]
MSPSLPFLILGLLSVACSTGKPMDSNPEPTTPNSEVREATFAAG